MHNKDSFSFTSHATAADSAVSRTIELAELAAMSFRQLGEVYRWGTVPATVAALDGEPLCRLLAVRSPYLGPLAGLSRRLLDATSLVWAGKIFESIDDAHGAGVNRLRLDAERAVFPFDTRVEPSAVDGEPCITLDYDRPENPAVVRRIRDELREVATGLFMGPAMIDVGGRPWLALYFACDVLAAAEP